MALIITFSSRRIFLCAIDTVSRVFEEGDAYVEEATTSDTQRKERFESDHHDSSSEDGDAIADMPLGKAIKLKEKLGVRLFNKAFFGSSSTDKTQPYKPRTFKRDNPKRPREISSKKRVPKFRNILGNEKINKNIKYDPRFDERCGAFDEFLYRANYSFLDDIRREEKKVWFLLFFEDFRTLAESDRRKEVIRELRRENNERLRQGLKPVFKTRAQIRRRVLEKKFGELKKSNKLNRYMQRRAEQKKFVLRDCIILCLVYGFVEF
ncbi:unnamed protein product [Enterobius vermicularis]|uniref:rRNA biogenesis protein RRP36 n=1 Tax=Enterobius vermicularis TaxID=51028 RepID=A0A158QAG8_ENTVE|nr:unnamed protein product [Enterobius vermicularis]